MYGGQKAFLAWVTLVPVGAEDAGAVSGVASFATVSTFRREGTRWKIESHGDPSLLAGLLQSALEHRKTESRKRPAVVAAPETSNLKLPRRLSE